MRSSSSSMSQSPQPTDSQDLLQSMLQKLKIQPGKDGQAHLQTPGSPPEAFTVGPDRERGGPNHQEVDNKPMISFDFDISPSKKAPVSAGRFAQQPGPGHYVGRGWTSFASQKVDLDEDTGERRVPVGSPSQIKFSPKGTGQLFPGPSKDVSLTSFKSTDGSSGKSMMTNHVPLNTNQSFTPMWSHANTAGEESQVLHAENGGTDGSKESTDVQIFSGNQGTTNTRKKHPSVNKKKRWTQKIRERWKEKLSKKEREDEGDQRTEEQGAQISTTNQAAMAGNFTNTPSNHRERSLPSLSSCSPSKTFPSQTENTTDSIRLSSDFDLGLGSFSLLEEITKGQEWARFFNPNLHFTSVNQRSPEEPQAKIPPNPFNPDQTPGSLNQPGERSGSWTFWTMESSWASVFRVGQTAPPSVSMDVTEGKQESVYREADQVELMEDGQNRSDSQRRESRPPLGPSAVTQPSDILYNAVLKVRGQTSRKRQHQPAERASPKSTSFTSHAMEDAPEPRQGGVSPLTALKSPPLFPSSDSSAPVPRGILKHFMAHDSEVTMTKRRRVEENRQVHFSDVVTAIESPTVDLDFTDSEEDSEEDSEKDSSGDENSLLDQEFEEEQVASEEVLRARRFALRGWIKALKRKNMGKKHS